MIPKMGPRGSTPSANGSVRFEFEQEINLPITDELMELCSEGAISIHVLREGASLKKILLIGHVMKNDANNLFW